MNEGLADARRTLPSGINTVNSKDRWRRDNEQGLFLGYGPLSSKEVNVNATAHKDILDNYAFSFVAAVWGRPFPFPA